MRNNEETSKILVKYKQYLRLEKGLSENTLDAYLTDLSKLMRFLETEGIHPLEVTLDNLETFSATLKDVGIAARSQARILSGIRSFYHFLLMEDYLKKMPEDSDFRMVFDAIDKFEKKQTDEANLMAEQLIAKGSPDGYTVQGIMAIERGDTLEGRRLMGQAAAQGSTFAELILFFSEWNTHNTPNIKRLKELSDKMPLANVILAKFYAKSERNEQLAAHYYLKADEKAFLGKKGARWLLSNRQFIDMSLSKRDIERLQTLAGERVIEESDEIIEVDTLGTE